MSLASLTRHPLFALISTISAILLTAWISIAPLNDLTQKDISDIYQNILTPAGFTFSIWSLIYVSWIFWAILPFLPGLPQLTHVPWKGRWQSFVDRALHRHHEILGNDRVQFIWAMFLSVLWLVTWHFLLIGWSVIIMLVLAWLLFSLYRKKSSLPPVFSLSVQITFAWIAIALVANVAAYIVSLGWVVDAIDNERLAWFLGFPAIISIILLHNIQRSSVGLMVTTWSIIWLIAVQWWFALVQLVSLGLLMWTILSLGMMVLGKNKNER